MRSLFLLALGLFICFSMNPVLAQDSAKKAPLPEETAAARTTESTNSSPFQLILYGRPTCSWTKKYAEAFQKAGIPFSFQNVENSGAAGKMWAALKTSGWTGPSPKLPVIDLNGKATARPILPQIIDSAKEAMRQARHNNLPEHKKESAPPAPRVSRIPPSAERR